MHLLTNCPKCYMNKQTTFRFLKVERVAGIEPASLAWKAKVLPLNYTRALTIEISNNSIPHRSNWWWGKDSNLRRHSRQIYSLIPLTAWVPHPIKIKLYSIVARFNLETRQFLLVPPRRIELRTFSLQVSCSTS